MPFLKSAHTTFKIEIEALQNLQKRLDQQFNKACELILNNQGLLVFSGVGKSGYIARKLAATFTSTGTKAVFMQPAEAHHGDLGVLTQKDVWVALSYSGVTAEILDLLPALQQKKIRSLSITNNPQSTLAKATDLHLSLAVDKEACPLNLAPTASTTSMLVLGDALAIAVMQAKNFSAADFAKTHPAGTLGKKLSWTVQNVMRMGAQIPLVKADDSVFQAIFEMSKQGLGMTGVTHANGELLGVFTDGDLRRLLDQQPDLRDLKVIDYCTKPSQRIQENALVTDALELLRMKKINGLFVINSKNQPIGAFNWHDLSALGLV